MIKVLVLINIWVLTATVGIASMMNGWGLEPVNWGWIIFSYVFACTIGVVGAIINPSK